MGLQRVHWSAKRATGLRMVCRQVRGTGPRMVHWSVRAMGLQRVHWSVRATVLRMVHWSVRATVLRMVHWSARATVLRRVHWSARAMGLRRVHRSVRERHRSARERDRRLACESVALLGKWHSEGLMIVLLPIWGYETIRTWERPKTVLWGLLMVSVRGPQRMLVSAREPRRM